MTILGMMSGSSLDGLDLSCCTFELKKKSPLEIEWSFIKSDTIPFNDQWINLLQQAQQWNAHTLTLRDQEFGQYIGRLCVDFMQAHHLSPDLLAWHGHTLFHDPEYHSTFQLGHGAAVAAETGLPVVCQFRQMDIALGGQGAPLAPLADRYLLPKADVYINLGGICNLSLRKDEQWCSFDVCPCNQLLNRLAHQLGLAYDPEGKHAANGQMIESLWQQLNQWAYYPLAPPKSLDNNQILEEVWPMVRQAPGSIEDKLHTCCHHMGWQIAKAISDQLNDHPDTVQIVPTGGGTFNAYLLACISRYLEPIPHEICTLSHEMINYKEAALMGLMGFFYTQGITNVYHEITGSRADHVGGCLFQSWHKPQSWSG